MDPRAEERGRGGRPRLSHRVTRIEGRLRSIFSSRSWVSAIFLNGSTVAGTDQSGSDVDFTVIVSRPADRARALGLLRRRFGYRYLGLDHGVPTFRARRKIGVVILDRGTVDRWLGRLYRSPEDLRNLQGVIQHKIVEAVAVHDPQGVLPRFQKRATAYPARIRRVVLSEALRLLDEAYRNWGSRNEFNYVSELPSLLTEICTALYARNRRLFMVPFKRLHVDLKGLRPNIEREMYRLVRSGRTARTRAQARMTLGRILEKLRA